MNLIGIILAVGPAAAPTFGGLVQLADAAGIKRTTLLRTHRQAGPGRSSAAQMTEILARVEAWAAARLRPLLGIGPSHSGLRRPHGRGAAW